MKLCYHFLNFNYLNVLFRAINKVLFTKWILERISFLALFARVSKNIYNIILFAFNSQIIFFVL